MSRSSGVVLSYPSEAAGSSKNVSDLMDLIGVKRKASGVDPCTLPFSLGDVTAGSEAELQTLVSGRASDVDLPVTIEQSNYFANTLKRARAGDTPAKKIHDLENYLKSNHEGVWENSWVRFPYARLGAFAKSLLMEDLKSSKDDAQSAFRSDRDRFLISCQGEKWVRVPVSYLLKLALAEAISSPAIAGADIRDTGLRVMDLFLNDNTSPETSSLYVVDTRHESDAGSGIAREMALRYLLTQLLVMYANVRLGLLENGQEAMIYLSPSPPIRQNQLSNCVSDAFYRELFMNPCLSGWRRGEEKYAYMHLCHQVLSRSQVNAVVKLREAGIITSNLVCLPNLSNISLANNGTHVSLGSVKLTELLKDASSGFNRYDEKVVGDLAVKIVEHFLPLFVGTYTAAPRRLNFSDFHPEKALGFLPHELDFTHLRMLWRRWRKKANLKIMGQPITPFGPPALDRILSVAFGLRGDYVPDFRLIDYLVALMSTDQSPALNGVFGNSLPLKKDLADLGVFDTNMSLYLFEKLRECEVMGFSGFEARHYSLFERFDEDMGQAVQLQNLLYCLAFKYMATAVLTHADIPDDPAIESERRQVIFGSAIDIPTFFVRHDTQNAFLKRILSATRQVRSSRRYPGYLRVYNQEFRLALIDTIRTDAADLIDMMGMKDTLNDLECRITEPEAYAASGRLTRGILQEAGADSAMDLGADAFNSGAERYYRTTLRHKHLDEAFSHLVCEMNDLTHETGAKLKTLVGGDPVESRLSHFINQTQREIQDGHASCESLEKMISMVLLCVRQKDALHGQLPNRQHPTEVEHASVY